jgi:hypothetical protein
MAFTPYSTLNPLNEITVIPPLVKPSWIPNTLDQERVLSYQLYEQIYWNVPETFKLTARSSDARPIYIPAAKTIIETINRYTAPDFGIRVEKDLTAEGTTDDLVACRQHFENFFTREKFLSKFNGNKRYGIIRGDWLWHLTANPLKAPGSRISINALDPASYFPIWHPTDLDRVIGCHIVDTIVDGDDTLISRLTYRKQLDVNGEPIAEAPITREHNWYELDDWEGPTAKPVKTILPLAEIPGITNIPVYHIKNFDEPANPFGSSELRGIERVIAGVNQAVSDQELALALDGIGYYWTDAPPPVDDDGKPTDWVIGPGRMTEIPPGSKLGRVEGVSSFQASMEHINFLMDSIKQATGANDAAIGLVDVSVEVSGVALFLQLAPLLARTKEKETGIIETHQQMFYDLATEWFPLYDSVTFNGVRIVPTVGEKLPVDRKQVLEELKFMVENNIASAAYIRLQLTKLGYVFPEGVGAELIKERAAIAQAEDPFASRVEGELGASV